MSTKNVKRGFDPDDVKIFSNESIEELKIAQEEIQWLLDRGYKIKQIIEFTGNHYLLSARARTALQRTTSSTADYEKRRSTMLPFGCAKDGCLNIDGFNLIITLEVAMSGSPILLGKDGVFRDLAGLRGTYRLIDKTDTALNLIGKTLQELHVPIVKFYLDSPVSNSGRLKSKILECSGQWGMPVEVELIPNVDAVLAGKERIVTGDSIILDECKSWFNLSRKIIKDHIQDAWMIDLG
ncbi:MAG TPA: DUF434 domain-containing protein [Clostridiales bacterium]|jgi:hypothetical protein|nr:DUF434 domain-containing protein [Clostridiales bacterium]HCS12011.1 DUF434 domain-containing protein [Clostridiales bacterium]